MLLCAFPGTPKFREVKRDGGTIASPLWVRECYRQKRVLPMAPFLMWEGRPWRKEEGKGKGREEGAAVGGLGRLPYSDGQVVSWVQLDIKAVERYLREQEDGVRPFYAHDCVEMEETHPNPAPPHPTPPLSSRPCSLMMSPSWWRQLAG